MTQWYLSRETRAGRRACSLPSASSVEKTPPSKSAASESIRSSVKREPASVVILDGQPARLEDGVVLGTAHRHWRPLQLQRLEHAPVGRVRLTSGQLQAGLQLRQQLAEPAVHVHGLPTALGGVAREAVGARPLSR